MVASVGGPDELGRLFQLALDGNENRRQIILTALANSGRDRPEIPAGDVTKIGPLLDSTNQSIRKAAIECAGLWKVASLQNKLIELTNDRESPEGIRHAAIDAITALGSDECKATLASLTKADQPTSVRARAIAGLSRHQPQLAANAAVGLWQRACSAQQPQRTRARGPRRIAAARPRRAAGRRATTQRGL